MRQYQEELKYLEKIDECCWRIKKGFQPNMNVIFFFFIAYNTKHSCKINRLTDIDTS